MLCLRSASWFLVLLVGRLLSVSSFQVPGRSLAAVSCRPRRSITGTTTELREAGGGAAAIASLDAFFQSSPYGAAAITCGFKASTADLVAQKRQFNKRDHTADQHNEPDWRRNVAFTLYGAIYQGMAQEFIYNHLYPTFFGAGTSVGIVLSKVLFDLLIQTTLLTLPIAYLIKAMIYQYSPREAFRRYLDDVKNHGLLKKYFLLWGPVQCITFSIIPVHYRVTFIACVSFFWLIILSTIATKVRPQKEEEVEESSSYPECELADGLTCNIDG